MDLRALEAVIAVHEHGSFSGAAEALFISQPALTRRVALLERELDARLFVRAPRGVYLTDAGRALIEPARRALRETDSIRGAIGLIRGGIRGTLSIVGTPNLCGVSLGRVIGHFHQTLPDIEVKVVAVETHAAAAAMVESGAHDLAIVDMPVASDSLSVMSVMEEDFLAIFAPGSTNTDQSGALPTVTSDMLAGRTMVHLPAAQFPKRRGMELFDMPNVEKPRSYMEVASCGLIVPIARAGHAVALLPRAAAMISRSMGMDVAEPTRAIRRTIGLVRHRSNNSPSVMQFLRMAVSAGELSA